MPRIVADTNVYISALNFAGPADEVLALGRGGVVEVFISSVILEEIEGVLLRKFRWTAARVREATRAIRSFAVPVNPEEHVNVVREDEPDNRILECALAATADVIMSPIRYPQRFRLGVPVGLNQVGAEDSAQAVLPGGERGQRDQGQRESGMRARSGNGGSETRAGPEARTAT